MHPRLPRFEVVARHRPVAMVAEATEGGAVVRRAGEAAEVEAPLPRPAPFAAVELHLDPADGRGAARAWLRDPDGTVLTAHLDDDRVSISVVDQRTPLVDGEGPRTRSRRHGRCARVPEALALTLTGPHLAAVTREAGRWRVRCRVDLREAGLAPHRDVHDADWLAGLHAGVRAERSATSWAAGPFGQLGLRDLRIATHADGSALRLDDGRVLLTATSAGPGWFDTGHTSLWTFDPATADIERRGALYVTRPDVAGVRGDHASHLLRDDGEWLLATSTWSTLPSEPRRRAEARVDVVVGRSAADLSTGEHVVATRRLDLPAPAGTVGLWDPHLVREDAGWLVGYVRARRFFDFHPMLATGPSLDQLRERASADERTATEGITLAVVDGERIALASDGADSARGLRRRFPVFDLDLRETGVLEAPYGTNIPWPTLVAPSADGEPWHVVTFDGTPAGGRLPGYGTHGDVVVMRGAVPGNA